MSTLILTQAEIPALLPMSECIDAMAEVLATVARGDATLPLRSMLFLPDSPNIFALMPARLGAPPCVGVKVITVFPGNHAAGLDSHQGAVLLFDTEHGRLLAVLDATSITAIRTAAVSAVATRLLAREGADSLALLGAGVQARTHLEAIRLVRPVRDVRIWSRTRASAERLAAEARDRWGIEATVAATAADAVRDAAIVCTVTSSREPVLRGEWLSPGAHVNAVGTATRTARELDTAAVVRARLFVDRRESALAEPGDIIVPLAEGAIAPDHIVAEIGELLLGAPGRRSDDEITLFKSLGLAVEDLAAAHRLYERARREKRGTWLELGGARE